MLPHHHHRIVVDIRFGPATRRSIVAALIIAGLKVATASLPIVHALATHIRWLP
jgi:hypothetical protein